MHGEPLPRPRRSLQTKILALLGAYSLLLTAAVFVHGFLVNEFAERLIWDSLLHTELDHHLQRRANDPGYRWNDTDSLAMYVQGDGRELPSAFANLSDGIHDELVVGNREVLVLVQQVDGRRHVLALDITELESQEDLLTAFVLGTSVLLVLVMGLIVALGLRRALQPVTDLAAAIGRLKPDQPSQRVDIDERASSELLVIGNAVNDYLQRQERFVERERAFIDSASHELRTPIGVIGGAVGLALEQPGLPASAANPLRRAQRTVRDVEQLVSLLLVLAKDPARLARIADRVALDELIPEIVDNHRHLCEGRELEIVIDRLTPCLIEAPVQIVQAAVGNLVRNAIENSDHGVIRIALDGNALVSIADPGHGMSPEEISRIYAQLARGGGRHAGGIGLDLIGRLCDHLGWRLAFRSAPGQGTVCTLQLRSTTAPANAGDRSA